MPKKKPRRTSDEIRRLVMDLRLIDDVFFERFALDAKAVEEMLQVILETPALRIKPETLAPQKSIGNIAKRSVRLDAYVEGNEDAVFNIEIQRSVACNHVKRVRFNASAITINNSEPGDAFEHVQDVTVIYISEFDVFGKNKTIYHTETMIRETGEAVGDGFKAVYVNTAVDDGGRIAKLMKCFMKPDFYEKDFPRISARVHELKHGEKEVDTMCKSVEEYVRREREKALAEGQMKGRMQLLEKMLSRGYSMEEVMELGFTLEEYETVKAELVQTV